MEIAGDATLLLNISTTNVSTCTVLSEMISGILMNTKSVMFEAG